MTVILEIFAIWCAASIGYGVLMIIKPLPVKKNMDQRATAFASAPHGQAAGKDVSA